MAEQGPRSEGWFYGGGRAIVNVILRGQEVEGKCDGAKCFHEERSLWNNIHIHAMCGHLCRAGMCMYVCVSAGRRSVYFSLCVYATIQKFEICSSKTYIISLSKTKFP